MRKLWALALALGIALAQVSEELRAAQAALDARRYAEAIRVYEGIIAKDYNNYEAHFGLGLALYRQGDLRGARFEFLQLTIIDPERFEGWYNLGITLDRLGLPADAASALLRSISVADAAKVVLSDQRAAFLALVKVQRSQNQFAAAVDTLNAALAKFPDDREFALLQFESLLQAERSAEAIPLLYSFLAKEPGNATAVGFLADALIAQELTDRAIRELDRGIPQVSDRSARAQLLFKKSSLQIGAARETTLVETVRLDPSLWQAYFNLGLLRLQNNNPQGAEFPLRTAYRSAPEDFRVVFALASTYERLGKGADAARMAAIAAQLGQGPEKAEALLLQARLAYANGRFSEAAKALTEVTQIQTERAVAWLLLGLSQYSLNSFAASVASLERALALEPSAETAANLGAAYLKTEQFARAEEVLRQAVSLNTRNPVAWFNLGWALRSLGREAEARRAWQQAANLGYQPARALLR